MDWVILKYWPSCWIAEDENRMHIIQERSILGGFRSYLPPRKQTHGRNFVKITAQRRDFHGNSRNKQQTQVKFPLKFSNSVIARAAVAVFGLGFIDAGYSGDWSRIGVISKESEELLKIVAFVVVPFCIFLLFSFPSEPEA